MNLKKSSSTLNINLIARELVDLLKEKNLKIATAESCTGGLISKLITDIPGASLVFECGVCAYSNCIKEKLLYVSPKTLSAHTEVSKEVAMEMAANIKKIANADIGLSTTGYAGPKTSNLNENVGLVYIGLSNMTKTTYTHINLNSQQPKDFSRDYIRYFASYQALIATINLIKTGVIK